MKKFLYSSLLCGVLADFEVTMRLCREKKKNGKIQVQRNAVTETGAFLWMGSDQDPDALGKHNLYEVPVDLGHDGELAKGKPVTATVKGHDFTPDTTRINTYFPDSENVLCFEELTVTRSDGETFDLIELSPKSTVPDPETDWTPAVEGKKMMYYTNNCARIECNLCKTGAFQITCATDRSYEFKPINECENDEDNDCDENATCDDTQYGYTCTCNAPQWVPNYLMGQVSQHGEPGCDKGPEPEPWTPWGPCSVTCGQGTQTRERADKSETETKDCDMGECPECECAGDDMICDDAFNCPDGESCQQTNPLEGKMGMKCTPNEFGSCTVYGDPHVSTFDNAKNDVFGTGEYLLAQHGIDRDGSCNAAGGDEYCWSVIIDNEATGQASSLNGVTFYVKQGEMEGTVTCSRDNCEVDGAPAPFARAVDLNMYTNDDDKFEAVWKIPGAGVIMKYVADHWFELKVAAMYKEKVEGICGQYDANCQNDFTVKGETQYVNEELHNVQCGSHSDQIVSDAEYDSAKSWKIQQDHFGVHPSLVNRKCDKNKRCSQLLEASWMSDCNHAVDVTSYMDACKVDICQTDSTAAVMDTFTSYISACKAKNPQANGVCKWREELGLANCASGTVWSGCASHCQMNKTCATARNECPRPPLGFPAYSETCVCRKDKKGARVWVDDDKNACTMEKPCKSACGEDACVANYVTSKKKKLNKYKQCTRKHIRAWEQDDGPQRRSAWDGPVDERGPDLSEGCEYEICSRKTQVTYYKRCIKRNEKAMKRNKRG